MIDKIKALFAVLKKGEQVADPASWKNRQVAVSAVTGLLVAVVAGSKAFGYDLGVSDAQIESAVIGGASVIGLGMSIWTTLATSRKVGIGGKHE